MDKYYITKAKKSEVDPVAYRNTMRQRRRERSITRSLKIIEALDTTEKRISSEKCTIHDDHCAVELSNNNKVELACPIILLQWMGRAALFSDKWKKEITKDYELIRKYG